MTFSCLLRSEPFEWVRTLPEPWLLSEQDFEAHLDKFQKKYPDFHDRLKAINLWRIGTPYGLYCLGEESGIDNDPLIRFDSSDCTVHVLTTIAFANSSNWIEARESMIDIHYKMNEYKEKKPSYRSRWHFTSDRLLNHHNTIDITKSVVNINQLETIEIELNKKQNGEEFLDLGWTLKESISFIPSNKLSSNILRSLPKVCGVAFVKRNYFDLGIVVAHEGYIIDHSNLIHASSEYGQTVNINFFNYLKKDNSYRFDGVLFYKIKETK